MSEAKVEWNQLALEMACYAIRDNRPDGDFPICVNDLKAAIRAYIEHAALDLSMEAKKLTAEAEQRGYAKCQADAHLAREEGAVRELLCVVGFAEAAFPRSRVVRTLVADLRRGEHTKRLGYLEHIGASDSSAGSVPMVCMPRRTAALVRNAFLPLNPNKLRAADPEVKEAARIFIDLLGGGPKAEESAGSVPGGREGGG